MYGPEPRKARINYVGASYDSACQLETARISAVTCLIVDGRLGARLGSHYEYSRGSECRLERGMVHIF